VVPPAGVATTVPGKQPTPQLLHVQVAANFCAACRAGEHRFCRLSVFVGFCRARAYKLPVRKPARGGKRQARTNSPFENRRAAGNAQGGAASRPGRGPTVCAAVCGALRVSTETPADNLEQLRPEPIHRL
jgi:hypothetical protein